MSRAEQCFSIVGGERSAEKDEERRKDGSGKKKGE